MTSSGSVLKIRSISSLSSGLPGTMRLMLDGGLAAIEPQIGLARGAVRPMAAETILGQDRPDVAIELNRTARPVPERLPAGHRPLGPARTPDQKPPAQVYNNPRANKPRRMGNTSGMKRKAG